MISLLKIINELEINKPNFLKFEDLKEDDIIEITFSNNVTGEKRTEIGEVNLDSDNNEKWINFNPLTNIDYWRHELELFGEEDENPWFQIFPENIISMKKAKRPINELEIKNPTVNKKALFEELKNNHIYLLYYMTKSASLGNLANYDGAGDTLEGFLESEFGYGEEIIPHLVDLIKKYFRVFKYGEIMMFCNSINNGKELKQDISPYSTLEIIEDDREIYVILHNFK